ncbi:MAG: YajQ family cyclic di-GMP-binding protein [Calditrichaceae bacterium]|nr:YajQ family cyclic di-GMP-binding protein [Calditrichaceae bacterium]MBN2708380.1 YajQ family cyclic di-GMP-binding protein [Calditrichaceae bacterium]
MPSFDVVSEVNMHELMNAVDQANKEVTNRFDFKGSNSKFELKDNMVTMYSDSEFQIKQMMDILQGKMVKRKIDLKFLVPGKILESGKGVRQEIEIRQGIQQELAKKMTKMVRDSKMKVQAAVQGDKLRITGKKKDDLQEVIALFKNADLDIPLQYENFRE